MTVGLRDMLLIGVWCVALVVLTVLLSACSPLHPAPIDPTGNAIARIDARAEGIQHDSDRLKDLTSDAGKPLVASVKDQAGLIRSDASEASKSNAKAASDYSALQVKFDKAYNSIGNKIERTIRRFLWIASCLIGLGMILRVVGFAVAGPWGAAASFIATGIFGVFSGGFSIVQSVFDNLWFRKFAPRGQS